MNEENLSDDFNDSSHDNKLEIFNEFKNLNIWDKSLKIEAYPWVWKTFLISKLIKLADLRNEWYIAISHMNSSVDTLEWKLKWLEIKNPNVQTFVSFFLSKFLLSIWFKISNSNEHNFTIDDEKFIDKNLNSEFKKVSEDKTDRFGRVIQTSSEKIRLLNIALNDFIILNLKTNKWFSESDIDWRNEWWFIKYLIIFYLQKDKYLVFFAKLLKSEWIKYIFIDEYQDTDIEFMNIVKDLIKQKEFLFYITGDIDQDLSYNNGEVIKFSDIDNLLEEKNIDILTNPMRYHEQWEIFELIKTLKENQFNLGDWNTICWFNSCINQINWCYSNNLTYLNTPFREPQSNKKIEETSYINKIVDNLWTFIVDNIEVFKWKNNVILSFIQTDNKLWARIVKDIESKLNLLSDEINIVWWEKNITDYHLPKFIEKIILFINNKKNPYSDIEKELKFIINYWNSNINIFFEAIISLNKSDNIELLIEKLNTIFLNDEVTIKKSYLENDKLKKVLTLLKSSLWSELISDIDLNNKKLYDIIKSSSDDIAKFTINTIHSSKWKEYDNVIILELTNQWYTKVWIKDWLVNELWQNREKQFRNMYYVWLSRAKQKIFTFIDF